MRSFNRPVGTLKKTSSWSRISADVSLSPSTVARNPERSETLALISMFVGMTPTGLGMVQSTARGGDRSPRDP